MKESEDMKDYIVYDAKDMVLGRIGSKVAKELLDGKKIAVINADMAFITGNKLSIIARYKTRLRLQEKENPEHSPYWSRRPDMLVRRIIRGMLPYHKKPRGKAAYRRLRVYSGIPPALANVKPVNYQTKGPRLMYVKSMYIKDLSRELGYNRV